MMKGLFKNLMLGTFRNGKLRLRQFPCTLTPSSLTLRQEDEGRNSPLPLKEGLGGEGSVQARQTRHKGTNRLDYRKALIDKPVQILNALLQDIIERALAVIFSDRFTVILSHFTDLGTAEENEKIL